MDIPPSRPKDTSLEELGFKWPKRMVRWFSPTQLARTAARAATAEIFGAYADKRELQAAIDAKQVYEADADSELWFDFVADLGDGFASTYTIAYLLSRPSLTVPTSPAGADPTAPEWVLPRGSILVMGGDEVYPTASRIEYRDRLVGPYQSAFPFLRPELGKRPRLFAIPGNHDWYDGLTNFLRLFTQQRSIGAWETCQARSYFAIRLPHRWWLWGTDIQLETDIDKPQLDYFLELAKQQMMPGDQVILCTATPSWVHGGEAYQNLAFFERKVIKQYGGTLALTLTGDSHHYARYQDAAGTSQKITAGGGGAYLASTHDLPGTIDLDAGDQVNRKATNRYHLKATFPTQEDSRRLVRWCLRLPLVNVGFAGFLGVLYLLYAWFVQSATKMLNGFHLSFMEEVVGYSLRWPGICSVLNDWWKAVAHSPATVVFTLVILATLTFFPEPDPPGWKGILKARLAGGLHGLAHLALNLALIWLFAYLNLRVFGWRAQDTDSTSHVLAFSLEMVIVGGILGSVLMAVYLIAASGFLGLHANEVFSAQGIADYKNFLRLHIDRTGKLTVYPLGVRRVCRRRDWRFNPTGAPEDPIFTPTAAIRVQAIEPRVSLAAPVAGGGR
jgi:hypothetical protein